MRLINADAVIEILKGNKQFFIDAWGGSFHAMSEKAKARYDEIDNCIATILNAPTIEHCDDTISRRAAILAITGEPPEAHYPSWYADRIKALPSAEVEDRLYIRIYADDEPSVMVEKLYQICGETQNREVAEWLKEYFPSAPDSRQRGEWLYHKNTMSCVRWSKWECSACHKKQEYKTDYCPSCGADMRGDVE